VAPLNVFSKIVTPRPTLLASPSRRFYTNPLTGATVVSATPVYSAPDDDHSALTASIKSYLTINTPKKTITPATKTPDNDDDTKTTDNDADTNIVTRDIDLPTTTTTPDKDDDEKTPHNDDDTNFVTKDNDPKTTAPESDAEKIVVSKNIDPPTMTLDSDADTVIVNQNIDPSTSSDNEGNTDTIDTRATKQTPDLLWKRPKKIPDSAEFMRPLHRLVVVKDPPCKIDGQSIDLDLVQQNFHEAKQIRLGPEGASWIIHKGKS
jgi:hypothetical protein